MCAGGPREFSLIGEKWWSGPLVLVNLGAHAAFQESIPAQGISGEWRRTIVRSGGEDVFGHEPRT